jgi:hypothetical protein
MIDFFLQFDLATIREGITCWQPTSDPRVAQARFLFLSALKLLGIGSAFEQIQRSEISIEMRLSRFKGPNG